jgi:hypothetical protein
MQAITSTILELASSPTPLVIPLITGDYKMKRRKSTLSSVVVLAVAVLIIGCATKPYLSTDDEPLYGTWVNEEYEGYIEGSMFIYYPDGKGLSYGRKTDPEPRWEWRLTIEDKWTDQEGNINYKVFAKLGDRPYQESLADPMRISIKVNPSGDVMEFVAYEGTKYIEVRPSDPRYMILYRQ